MKLLIEGDRIAGAAQDSYTGPMDTLLMPDGFDVDTADRYRVVDGVLVLQPPPEGQFSVLRWTIPADASEQAVVTYTASETVHFVVDDTLHAVEPIDGIATLEIFATAPGVIRIEVRDKSAVITAVEV